MKHRELYRRDARGQGHIDKMNITATYITYTHVKIAVPYVTNELDTDNQ